MNNRTTELIGAVSRIKGLWKGPLMPELIKRGYLSLRTPLNLALVFFCAMNCPASLFRFVNVFLST
jgi:hypothetical protein